MKIKFSLITFLLFLLLTGCNGDEPTSQASETDNQEQIEQIEVDKGTESVEAEKQESIVQAPPLPTTLDELANLPTGHTTWISTLEEEGRKLTDELTKDLPDISNNPTTEELDRYYEAILSVFQQDFVGPEELMDELKFRTIGDPEIEDSRYQFKENLNVMVILDASGSMANMEGNQTRMEAAKTAINAFVKNLPKEANVGLRIYGHKGSGNESDKALSCSSSELVYPMSTYNASNFEQALSKAKPAGWTPIGLALKEAEKDLSSYKGESNTNIVYLVSDGISTCDDQPVEVAKSLYNSDITPIVNVIGFNVDHEGQKQLQEIANATEGTYKNVTDAQGLQAQLEQANQVAKKWEQWKVSQEGWLGADKTDNWLDIFGYHTGEFKKWVDERQAVGFTLTYLYQHRDKMSRESHDYLKQKNVDYHNWIEEEYNKLRKDLETMNEMNYQELMKAMEEKYQTKTSTP